MELISDLRHIISKADRRMNGNLSFFFRHWGKTKFMMAMSKKLQYHGIEKLYSMGVKDFWWFFFLYLLRDSIIYVAVPIYIAKLTV